ncbi:MAG: hypothetical protein WBN51_00445 [Gammaproteobacteria bacterium]
MNLDRVSSGRYLPIEINVIIEIPPRSDLVNKDLDEGKWVRVGGWHGRDAACAEIMNSVRMYQDAPEKTQLLSAVPLAAGLRHDN